MSFWSDLFHSGPRAESAVLIDIGADSVAGAYARYTEGEPASIVYARRLPIEFREGEPHDRAMLRALSQLGETLIREGAPALLRASGSGSADALLVSVDAPWQTTHVRTEFFEQKEPFTFTRRLVEMALEKTREEAPGRQLADESIIGTILNGYETREPYGKRVRRAAIIVMTSFIDENIAKGLQAILRGLFHTRHIVSIAGSSLRYQALRAAFPHEKDALIIDATSPLTSIALVRRDLLVDVAEIESPLADATLWFSKVSSELAALGERYPLPRTIFFLAREPDSAALSAALAGSGLSTLWLSDNPPKVVAVQGSHLAGAIRQLTTEAPDLALSLMTLFYPYRSGA